MLSIQTDCLKPPIGAQIDFRGWEKRVTGFVAGLSGKPQEEAFQGRKRTVQGRLAQRVTAAARLLPRQIAFKRLGLIDMEGFEVLVTGEDFEPGNGLARGLQFVFFGGRFAGSVLS